ncbi:MAG: thiaminase II [Chloroflexi bacterium]|nr:thiaminase II [Chloroflexota bacterium]
MERFTSRLRAAAEPIWAAQHAHPFVAGIADGTLDLDRFRFWVRQDYRFLTEYARVFALGAARAPDLATMTAFAELLRATLVDEMALHRAYASAFDIQPSELEHEPLAAENAAYADFLLRTAALADFAELLAALLPCMWAYSEIGLRLAERPRPSEERLARWIDMYADSRFAALARWCRDLLDGAAEGAGSAELVRLEAAFLTSSRHELAFWNMAWRGHV